MGLENATINYKLNWVQSDRTIGDTVVVDNGALNLSYLYGSGTGTGEVNKVWYATGQIPTGSENTINFYSLTRTIFNSNISINFSGGKIKTVLVKNLNTGDGEYITLVAENFPQPYNNGIAGSGPSFIRVEPESVYLINNKFGYTMASGKHTIKLRDDGGYAPLYEITVLGSV